MAGAALGSVSPQAPVAIPGPVMLRLLPSGAEERSFSCRGRRRALPLERERNLPVQAARDGFPVRSIAFVLLQLDFRRLVPVCLRIPAQLL